MPTIASGTTSYATLTDLQSRYDIRPLAQLLGDAGVPLTQAQLATQASLTAILQEASGWVEASCVAGGRYLITPTQNDLQTIASSGTNSAQLLIGLVCAIAYFLIWERRPEWLGGSADRLPKSVELRLKMLDDLNNGKTVLGTLEGENAGQLNDVVDTTLVIQQQRGTLYTARALFGPRVRDFVGTNPPPQTSP